jgi:H+/gluconate symporter-like permease
MDKNTKKQSLKIMLAPFLVPIVPAIFAGVTDYVIKTLELYTYHSTNLSEVWQSAQLSVINETPDPVLLSIVVYIFCIPVIYLMMGQAMSKKAQKEENKTELT